MVWAEQDAGRWSMGTPLDAGWVEKRDNPVSDLSTSLEGRLLKTRLGANES
jgi:hypothetical protein